MISGLAIAHCLGSKMPVKETIPGPVWEVLDKSNQGHVSCLSQQDNKESSVSEVVGAAGTPSLVRKAI